VAEDETNTALVNSNTELVEEGVLAIRVTPVEKEARLDGTVSVDRCYVGKGVKDGVNVPIDKLNKTVA
jgi:hypothetical protein